jgi:trans-aconitate 2-methyltransferase
MVEKRSIWSPTQYEKFRDERSRPFYDLMSLVEPIPGGRAVDLGCGTGELTRTLHEASKAADTLGIDSSDTMLANSDAYHVPGLRFELADLATFRPAEPVDLVFSNAALQWVGGHEALFTRIAGYIAGNGQIAIQMPANDDHPSHVTAHRVAREEPFRTALGGYVRDWPVQSPEWYATLLDRLGFRVQAVRLEVYGHHLPSREGVVEWVKGTLLTDYQKRMRVELWDEYLERYRAALLPQLTNTHPFFYPFKRILIWGRK